MNFADIKDRFQKWFFLMPSGTKTLFITILSFYIFKVFWSDEEVDTCINPTEILGNLFIALPRFILHSLVHANIFHLVFNSIALICLAASFEKHNGTVLTLYLTFVFSTLIAIIYVVIAKILSFFSITHFMSTCTIGISGVLFTMIVIESLKNETIKHIYNMDIPSKYNHWILLVVAQLVWPHASFLGHLSGIIVGYLYQLGYIDFLMLSHNTIYNIEQKLPLNLSSFVVHNGGAALPIFQDQRHEYANLNEDYDDIFPDDDEDVSAERIYDDENAGLETPLVNGLINNSNSNNPIHTQTNNVTSNTNSLQNHQSSSVEVPLMGNVDDSSILNSPTTTTAATITNVSNQTSQENKINTTENSFN